MVVPEAARPSDASGLLALREDAAAWMRRRRIRQWALGEVTLEAIVGQVRRGEWFVVRGDHTVVAAVRVLTNDDSAWGSRPPDALYVHGLVVHRRYVGRALGRQLLEWVESLAATTGRSFIRLDCVEGNLALRYYYRAAGYHEVGRHDFDPPWLPATLFEKALASR